MTGSGSRTWCSGRKRRASRRKENEKPGNIATTRPERERYQEAHPPSCQTVRSISRWTQSVYAASAPARTSMLAAPASSAVLIARMRYSICASITKIALVWPMPVLGPVTTKKLGNPGTVVPR